MTTPHIAIATIAPEPEVVEVLEDLLSRAKAGTLRGFCIAGEMVGRETVSVRAGDFAMLEMIGQLHLLAQRLGRTLLDGESDGE